MSYKAGAVGLSLADYPLHSVDAIMLHSAEASFQGVVFHAQLLAPRRVGGTARRRGGVDGVREYRNYSVRGIIF